MQFLHPIPISSFLTFIFINFFLLLFFTSLADPRVTPAGVYCGKPNLPPDSSPSKYTTRNNFVKEVEVLAHHTGKNHKWGYHIFNPHTGLYGLSQCTKDLSLSECRHCFNTLRQKLQTCPASNSTRIYLDGCFLRFENYSFFGETTDSKLDKVECNSPPPENGVEDYIDIQFAHNADETITNVTEAAVRNKGFAVAEVRSNAVEVYVLAQCWDSVSNGGCKACLDKAGGELRQCLPKKEGRVLNSGCYLRYSTKKFYNDKPANNEADFSIMLIAVGSVTLALLALFGACIGYTRMLEKKGKGDIIQFSSAPTDSNLNFRYEILERATNNFSSANKLGAGGSGTGTLPNGKIVAVKRLCYNTRQWADEFFNEVNLVSGIQHKNLVKLLGCSIAGPESLLVYEYLANASLSHILFDRKKRQIITWKQRFDIIIGIAEGLAYLHGGIPTKIIHRDIKCSNILLDEKLTPKIADFGLIRGYTADKTHVSTGIAGTLGYLAPEYLIRGQLTEKADVYSFGVLIIEIVCGRKNNAFVEDSVLHMVWNHYNSKSMHECVDFNLSGDFPTEQASKVLQIGLLCTQAKATLRPFMSEIVQMLTDNDYNIHEPRQPPFLNSSVVGSVTPEVPDSMQLSVSASSEDTTYHSIRTLGEIVNAKNHVHALR
ncbi:hypothetical protein Syun_020495 [Stephania yunnanensis]|uniref:Cysteine-rich receptor-like protein kinase 1 n=1 Tax=Stephania yunnanensis TaxID=152371 RepID=A0AAP0IE13_9MAGN